MLSLYDKFTDVYGVGTVISKPDINTSDQMTQSFNELEAINSDDLPIFDYIISLDAASNGFQNSYAGIHKQLPSRKIGEYIAAEINDLKQILDNPAKIREYFGLDNISVNSEVEFDSIIDNFYKKNHKANKIVPKIKDKNITVSDETLESNPAIPLAFEIKTSQSYSNRKYLKREMTIDGKKILVLYRNSGKVSGEGSSEKVLFYLTPIKSPSYNLTEMHSEVNSIVNADKLNYTMSEKDLKNTARLLKSKLERLKEEKMVEPKSTEITESKKLFKELSPEQRLDMRNKYSEESLESLESWFNNKSYEQQQHILSCL